MSAEANKDQRSSRIKRLDAIVMLVSLILLAMVGVLGYLAQPERKGATVAFLAPAYGGVQNVWISSVENPDPRPLTDSEWGVFDFAVSPDGRSIAYSERQPVDADDPTAGYLTEIMLIDLRSGQTRQLTNCIAEDADCKAPAFQPNGDLMAYERMTVNSDIDRVGPGALRIWLLDRRHNTTVPLSQDSQLVGHSPMWSDDGQTLAFYSADLASPGILVYQFGAPDGERKLKYIPSNYGIVGTMDPAGERLVFPEMVQITQAFEAEATTRFQTQLKVADLAALQFETLTRAEDGIDDTISRWHPDGERIAISRRYTDERATRGYQIVLLDTTTGEAEPLVFDAGYSHGFFSWNARGDKLVMQRFAVGGDEPRTDPARPGIWVKDLTSGALRQVADNAYFPRWVLP